MKSPVIRRPFLPAAALLLSLTAGSLHAADGTWKTAAGGSWDDSSKWDGTTIANDSGFTATFGPIAGTAGNYTITVDTDRSIGNLSFQGTSGNTNHITIGGTKTLTLAGGATPTITLNLPSRNATISATLAGTQGLATTNSSNTVLTLSGNNIYSGVTTVTSGVLTIGHNNALGAAGTGNGTTVSSNGTLILANGIKITGETLTLNASSSTSGALQTSGAAEWAGNILLNNSNSRIGTSNASSQLTVSGVIGNGTSGNLIISGLGTTVLSGVNTYTGSSLIYRGTLKLDGGNDRLPTGTAFSLGGTTDNSTFDLNGRNQQLAQIISFGTQASTRTITNSSATASTLTLDSSTDASFLGAGSAATVLSGKLSLVKNGTFNQTLATTNSYTGNTTINAGTLTLADDATMTFFIGANGVNNRILGTGSLALNGDFIFDLANAAAANGNTWLIASFSTLTESIGGTFTVRNFTKAGSIWYLGDYHFSELTGVLSYGAAVPEPSTCAALAGAVALGLCALRRPARK